MVSQVTVNQTSIDHIHSMYINADHPVVDLVPPSLGTLIENCYNELGRPNVDRSSVWTVYLALLHALQDHDHAVIQGVLSTIDPYEYNQLSVTRVYTKKNGCLSIHIVDTYNANGRSHWCPSLTYHLSRQRIH